MFQMSSDPQFAFYLEEVLALANNHGASTGEVLRIATGIVPLDFESVYNSFYPMAEAIYAQALSAQARNNNVSAKEAYFRAATYYRGANFFLIGNLSDPRNYDLWDRQLDAFDKATALMDIPVEKFSVPAQSSNVPGEKFQVIGRFFKAPNSDRKTPTVIAGSGYDGSQEELYHSFGVEVLSHGYNFVTYEGPGQPTVRRQQNIGFIPDWYNVLSPVVDYLIGRSDVDESKLALAGFSFGGVLAPIAASKEHRVTKVFAIDGLKSLQQVSNEQWPSSIIDVFNNGSAAEFNTIVRSIQNNASMPSSFRWFIDQSLFAFNTTDPYDWYSRLGNITMSPDVVQTILQPVFVAKGQDDTSTLNQPEIAYESLVFGRPNGSNLTFYHQFNTSLGAGEHCAIGAEAQLAQVLLEWLSDEWS